MKQETAMKHIINCLDEMYRASNPPTTWKECEEKYVGIENWFWKHDIDEKVYNTIKYKYKKKLDKFYASSLSWHLLNYSPKIREEKE